jgi:4'-phosphopantetheinyl transferase
MEEVIEQARSLLGDGRIVVVGRRIHEYEWPRLSHLNLLTDEELQRGLRMRIQDRGYRWLVAKCWQKLILGGVLRQEPSRIQFVIADGGKPYLPHGWDHLQFNASHSREWLLVALANGRAVGVDCEWLDPVRNVLDLARRFLHPMEYLYVKDGDGDGDQRQRFHRVWVRKEATLKCCGTGIGSGPGTGLADWPVIESPKRIQHGHGTWLKLDCVAGGCMVTDLMEVPEGYLGAVAVAGNQPVAIPVILNIEDQDWSEAQGQV